MSVTAVIDPVRSPGHPSGTPAPQAPERPAITALPSRAASARRPRLIYGLVAVAGLFQVIAAQLLVSIGLSQGAYTINGLQIEQRDLTRSNAAKQDAVDALSSPQNLASAAQGLGMVSNTAPVYLRLSDGAVLGDPATAAASATAAGAAMVPNALLAPSAAAASTAGAVAVQGELPAPTTH